MSYWTQPAMKERLDIKQQIQAAQSIISKVAKFYGLTTNEILGRCRERRLIKARFLSIYFIKQKTEFTLVTIGKIFNRDHASIIHALKTIKTVRELHYETDLLEDLKKLSNII